MLGQWSVRLIRRNSTRPRKQVPEHLKRQRVIKVEESTGEDKFKWIETSSKILLLSLGVGVAGSVAYYMYGTKRDSFIKKYKLFRYFSLDNDSIFEAFNEWVTFDFIQNDKKKTLSPSDL